MTVVCDHMIDQGRSGKNLDAALERIGYPSGRRGDARDRADLFGTTPVVVRQWITERYKSPAWVWIIIKLYSMLNADQRVEFRQWVRGQADDKH